MEMTKEELQRKVDELTQSLESFTKNTEMLKQDLIVAKNALKVADRPRITQDQMTEIQDAIYTVVNNVDFTDCNNYDMDFEIDYDNRIAVSNMEFNNSDDIADDICSEIECLFNVIQPEDEA
tara:strand:- start:78 stop:443 length:366 start_codon:yes stop_codon:yes gene_type:complete